MTLAESFILAADPALFALKAMGPKGGVPYLDDWQERIIRSQARNIIACTSRQVGKSTIIAAKASHPAIFQPGTFVLVTAAVGRQSNELFRKIKSCIKYSPVKVTIIKETATEIELSNGSRIVCVPGKAENVAGFSAPDILIIDEACYASDALYSTISPMRASNNGQIILISTPFVRSGFFFDAWESTDGDWEKYHVPATSVKRISLEFLEKERRRLGDWWFNSQYMGLFQDAEDTPFRSEWMARALDDSEEPLFLKPENQGRTEAPLFEEQFA